MIENQIHQQPWQGSGELDDTAPLIVAVADGVSTSPSPAAASRAVLSALRGSFERDPRRASRRHAEVIHEEICAHTTRAQRGMASTLAAVIVRGARAVVFNSGDSRVYRLSPGRAELLSRDHTALQRMLDEGEITPAQAAGAASFYSSLDSCFVADTFADPPDIFVREIDWTPGTTLLLCSDGLTCAVDDEAIAATEGEPAARVESLFVAALERGSKDDISLVILERGS